MFAQSFPFINSNSFKFFTIDSSDFLIYIIDLENQTTYSFLTVKVLTTENDSGSTT